MKAKGCIDIESDTARLFMRLIEDSGTGHADGVNDCIVLVRKDCAQIELDAVIADVSNDRWNRFAKRTCKIVHRTIFGQDVDR